MTSKILSSPEEHDQQHTFMHSAFIHLLGLPEQPVDHTVHNLLLQEDTAVSRLIALFDGSDSLAEQSVGSGQDV